jgi:hypothetical protein
MDKRHILESMKKAVKKVKQANDVKQDALDDLFDPNMQAEMPSNEIKASKIGVVNKAKEECECKGESEEDCECEEAAPMDKSEIIKSIMNNFKKISDAYLAKKEGRCWEGYEPTPGKKAYSKGSCQKKNETGDEPTLHPGKGQVGKDTQEKFKNIVDFNIKQRKKKEVKDRLAQKRAEAQKQNPKYNPMAASEGEMEKKESKPFHGYNKKKHSKKGGLSEKERNRINREEGSNLKAPVSSKEAKKSPKKAARRKSFCARMKGNKGPTSKDGKLTPKGAALKRWDC